MSLRQLFDKCEPHAGMIMREYADEKLRDAAPDLLKALLAMLRAETNQQHAAAGALAYTAIEKATGVAL